MKTRQVIGILSIVLGVYVGITAVLDWVGSYPFANIAPFFVFFAIAISLIIAGGYLLKQKAIPIM